MAFALAYGTGSMDYLPFFGIDLYPYGNFGIILYPVIMTYASIMSKMDKSQDAIAEMKRGKEITDMQIRAIEVQLQTMEIRLVRLETQFKTKE